MRTRPSFKVPGSIHYCGALLGTVVAMSAACGGSSHDAGGGVGGTVHGQPSSPSAGADGGPATGNSMTPTTGSGDPTTGSGTGMGGLNGGTPVNAAGYDAIKPLLMQHCGECHHAGSYLSFENGVDAATAQQIVTTLAGGSMPPAPRDPLSADDLARIQAWQAGQMGTVVAENDDPSATPMTQILDATTLAQYKAVLPKVAYPRLQKILQSPSTLFWDKQVMPGAYQDTVGDGSELPFGARLNSTGSSLIVPEGRKLFSDDGTTWNYPFGHTAGADAATNVFVVNFMNLPVDSAGKLLPIAYKIDVTTSDSFPNTRWNWSFPKGTVVGEIIMIKDASGALLTTEIRTRERFVDKWAINSFRPFPTAASLSLAVKTRKPGWASAPNLKALADALDGTAGLVAKEIDSPAFSNLVTLQGSVDAPLPDIGDDALVKDLLTTTTFISAYGTTWKTNGTAKAFGFTGPASGLSIVPAGADFGLLEVRETTCTKCHDQGGYIIGDLVSEAILYGDIWGVDRIFSFHPFDPSRIDASGAENRVVRSEFTQGGMVVQYNAATQPASLYTFYLPPRPATAGN